MSVARSDSVPPDSPSLEDSSSVNQDIDPELQRRPPVSSDAGDTINHEAPPPQVRTMEPVAAVLKGGGDITLTGTGFQPGARVFFGSTPLETTFDNSSQVHATLPRAMEPGSVSVMIVNPDGTSTLGVEFTYVEDGEAEVLGVEQDEPQGQQRAKPEGYPARVLRQGSKGDQVLTIQRRLKGLGFNVLADGVFGPSTHAAVVTIQRQNGIDEDGIVGPDTWAALFSQVLDDHGSEIPREPGSAQKAAVDTLEEASDQQDKPQVHQQARQQAQQQAQQTAFARQLLRQGSKGDDVANVQRRLKDLGFDVAADGNFGPSTRQAVVAFQQAQKLRSKDGMIGPNTWAALFAKGPGVPEIGAPEKSRVEQNIREGLAEEARERNALNDKPIDNFENDTLKFKDYVLALRDFVASQSTTTPLSISINGTWGSGKSSLMRMLQGQLDPDLAGLWLVQLRWLAGWFSGTFFWLVGQTLINAGTRNSDYIKLGFAFDPPTDVTDQNFEELFGKFVDYSLKGSPIIPDEREWRLKNARFWARQAARRRKMTPKRHPTVWFNAWKFNEQEQVWAALATAVLNQLKRKYGFFARLAFVSQLTFKRTDKLGTLKHLLRKLAVPLILAAVVAIYQLNRNILPAYLNLSLFSGSWSWLSDKLVWLAPALAAMWQALKAIDDPFKLPTEELVEQPNYKAKIGFIGTFEDDFQRIVRIAVRRSVFWQPRKLVIFIDDLDRCSPAQTAGIIEAINLFLDSVGCVFVLGMDVNAVAISIEVKYKELAERMRQDAPDSVSPGVLFLDKIVQIPFNVPRPNRESINALVTQITEPAIRQLPTIKARFTAPLPAQNEPPPPAVATGSVGTTPTRTRTPASHSPAPVSDRASFAQSDIREAISVASHLLKENPRQLKRFINLFRLQVYVADERGMLSDGKHSGLTPRKLAVWVAWSMQWPDIVKLLSSSANDQELSEHLQAMSMEYASQLKKAGHHWLVVSKIDMGTYLMTLKETRENHIDENTHWSRLPWPLWFRDPRFLQCLAELQDFWNDPDLLESILEMTQVTVSPTPASPPTPESPNAENIAAV